MLSLLPSTTESTTTAVGRRGGSATQRRSTIAVVAVVLALGCVALVGNRLSLTVETVATPIQSLLANDGASRATVPVPAPVPVPGHRELEQLATSFLPQTTWQLTLIENVMTTMRPYRNYILRYSISLSTYTLIGPMSAQFQPTLDYAMMLAFQAAICIVLGLFLSAFGCFFWCSRCCGCCCCCAKQGHKAISPNGYSLCNRMCVWFFLLVFGLGMGVGAFFGLSANQRITTGVQRVYAVPTTLATGLGERLTNLSNNLDAFGVSTTARINSLRGLLNGLDGVMPIVNASIRAVQNVTHEFDVVSALVSGLDANVTRIKQILQDLESNGLTGVPPSSSIPTIPSSTLTTVQSASSQAQQAVNQVSGLSETVFNQIQSVNNTLNGALNSATDTLLQVLNTTKQMLSTPQQAVAGVGTQISSFSSLVNTALTGREWGMFGVFVACVTLVFWTLLAGMCQCCVCFPRFCGCWMSFWGFTFFFWLLLLMAIHLALGIGMGDLCNNFTGSVTNTLSVFGMSASSQISFGTVNISLVSAIFDTLNCSGNGNLIDIFGLGTYFNLSAQFSIGSIFSFSFAGANFSTYLDMLNQFQNVSGFNFTALRAGFNATATSEQIDAVRANVSTSSLGAGTQADAEQRLDNLEALTGIGTVTFVNYTNIDPNSFPVSVQAFITGNKTAIEIFLTANVTVNNLLGNLTTINDKVLAIPGSLDRIDLAGDNVNNTVEAVRGYILDAKALQDDLLANVSGAIGILDLLQADLNVMKTAVGACAWIGLQYQELTTGLCTEFGGGSDVMWLALAILIISMFACVIIGVIAHQRWGRSPEWAAVHHPDVQASSGPTAAGNGGGGGGSGRGNYGSRQPRAAGARRTRSRRGGASDVEYGGSGSGAGSGPGTPQPVPQQQGQYGTAPMMPPSYNTQSIPMQPMQPMPMQQIQPMPMQPPMMPQRPVVVQPPVGYHMPNYYQ